MLFHLQTNDFILGTNIQPNNTHLATQMMMTLGQGHRSRLNIPKMGRKPKNWPYLGCYFTYKLHTWYQGTTHYGAFNDDTSADD